MELEVQLKTGWGERDRGAHHEEHCWEGHQGHDREQDGDVLEEGEVQCGGDTQLRLNVLGGGAPQGRHTLPKDVAVPVMLGLPFKVASVESSLTGRLACSSSERGWGLGLGGRSGCNRGLRNHTQ